MRKIKRDTASGLARLRATLFLSSLWMGGIGACGFLGVTVIYALIRQAAPADEMPGAALLLAPLGIIVVGGILAMSSAVVGALSVRDTLASACSTTAVCLQVLVEGLLFGLAMVITATVGQMVLRCIDIVLQ